MPFDEMTHIGTNIPIEGATVLTSMGRLGYLVPGQCPYSTALALYVCNTLVIVYSSATLAAKIQHTSTFHCVLN